MLQNRHDTLTAMLFSLCCGALNFKTMIEEERKFYAGFKNMQDHLTIDIQLKKIKDEMTNQLINEHGKIVPKQSRAELVEKFEDALDALGY